MIKSVTFPLPDASFITLPGENLLRLEAVAPDSMPDARLFWQIVDDTTGLLLTYPCGTRFRVRNPGRWVLH